MLMSMRVLIRLRMSSYFSMYRSVLSCMSSFLSFLQKHVQQKRLLSHDAFSSNVTNLASCCRFLMSSAFRAWPRASSASNFFWRPLFLPLRWAFRLMGKTEFFSALYIFPLQMVISMAGKMAIPSLKPPKSLIKAMNEQADLSSMYSLSANCSFKPQTSSPQADFQTGLFFSLRLSYARKFSCFGSRLISPRLSLLSMYSLGLRSNITPQFLFIYRLLKTRSNLPVFKFACMKETQMTSSMPDYAKVSYFSAPFLLFASFGSKAKDMLASDLVSGSPPI